MVRGLQKTKNELNEAMLRACCCLSILIAAVPVAANVDITVLGCPACVAVADKLHQMVIKVEPDPPRKETELVEVCSATDRPVLFRILMSPPIAGF